jgi:N6-adenosine-specific RNA methylase IME4
MSAPEPSADLALPGAVTTTALTLPADLSFERWEQVGETLGRIGRAHQWWIGDWINFGERAYGEKYAQAIEDTGLDYQTTANLAWVAGKVQSSWRQETLSWSHHQEVAKLEPAEQKRWLKRAVAEGWSSKELRREIKRPNELDPPAPAKGTFSTLVIDPPWPMEKIEREVRPNQAAPLDYRTMSEDELRAWTEPVERAAENAHLYLWTTHRFLPLALELTETWGFNYQCLLTWVKNVGITPFSWMYSTEIVVFARRGSLDLLVKGRRLDFQAKVREHSRKPDEFYDLVRDVSPGPRIDMFARGPHDGFETLGNETERFDES